MNHYFLADGFQYRVLPDETRISYLGALPSIEAYLHDVDRDLATAQPASPLFGAQESDLVSLVFSNQIADHASSSKRLARLILERKRLARKHLADIAWRRSEIQAHRPLLLYLSGRPGELLKIEQQMGDLDRQQREIELGLWQDLLELQKELHEERREYQATRSRMAYLTGGSVGVC